MAAPARFDFVGAYAAAQGTTFVADIYWTDSNGAPVSLAGKTPALTIWQRPQSSTAALECTIANGRIAVISEAGGHLRVTIAKADLEAMTARPYVYALTVLASGITQGLLAGVWELLLHGEGREYDEALSVTVQTQTTVVVVAAGAGPAGAAGPGVPSGGVAGRSILKIDGVDYNTSWNAWAVQVKTPASDLQAGLVNLTASALASSSSSSVAALEVAYTVNATELALALGGNTNAVGLRPIAALIGPASGDVGNRYSAKGLFTNSAGNFVGIGNVPHANGMSQIWMSTNSGLVLGYDGSGINAPAWVGGGNYYVMRAGTPPTVGNATSGYVVLTLRQSDRALVVHWSDGAQTVYTGTTTGP